MNTIKIDTKISKELLAKLDAYCELKSWSRSNAIRIAVEKLIIMETQLQDVQSDVFRNFIRMHHLSSIWDDFISGVPLCEHVFDTGYEFEHDPDIHCTKCGFRP